MTNPWIKHVEEFRAKHPNMSYKEVLQRAKSTYIGSTHSKPIGKKNGAGFLDIVKGALNGAANLVADQSINKLMPGELHGLLKLPNGKLARAQFMGPGTHVVERVKKGERGLTAVDTESKWHDIAYGLAKNQADIGAADRHMMSKINEFARDKKDIPWNLNQGRLIGIKATLDNFKPGLIGSSFGGVDPKDIPLYENTKKQLETAGYGKKRRPIRSTHKGKK